MDASKSDLLKSWLRQLIGKRIAAVSFSTYVATDKTYPLETSQIEIVCEGAERGMLVLSSDGESIEHSDDDLIVVDVGEYGHVERRGIVPGFEPAGVVGASVEDIDLIIEGKIVFGVEFRFSGGRKFIVVNNGDRMLLLSGRDHPALQEVGIRVERIC